MAQREGGTIISMHKQTRQLVAILVLTSFSTALLADDSLWEPLREKSLLTSFISDSRLEAEFSGGMTAVATYRADGTGFVVSWGGRFRRTWAIREQQICIESLTKSSCFDVERNTEDPNAYRLINKKGQQIEIYRTQSSDEEYFVLSDLAGDLSKRGSPLLDELAGEFINPNTNLAILTFETDYVRYDGDIPGASTQSRFVTTLKPIVPYIIGDPRNRTNFYFRPVVPIIWRADIPHEDGEFESEGIDLGDIGLSPTIRKTFNNGFIIGGGAAITLPTATDDALGLDQFLLGPSLALGLEKRWGYLAATLTSRWDVAGEDDYDTHVSSSQLLYAFKFSQGWQLFGAPNIIYDHEADSDNNLALPVSIGIAKTTLISGKPWRFAVEYWHYIETPDLFGPDYQVRFTVMPAIEVPWIKKLCDRLDRC
jgi:hypothetical protein